MSDAWFIWGMVFGCFGIGFFVYGKRQNKPVPLLCGLGLMIFPYLVSSTLLLVGIGALLMAIPYFVRT